MPLKHNSELSINNSIPFLHVLHDMFAVLKELGMTFLGIEEMYNLHKTSIEVIVLGSVRSLTGYQYNATMNLGFLHIA